MKMKIHLLKVENESLREERYLSKEEELKIEN